MNFAVTQRLVIKLLETLPRDKGWTLQGLGMLRYYLSESVRLHVWDNRYRNPEAHEIHTHPWAFRSTVICGELRNIRYRFRQTPTQGTTTLMRQTLRCGVGCHLVGEPLVVHLEPWQDNIPYRVGDSYSQTASEIHRTEYENGTVTLVERDLLGVTDPDHAWVFWPPGQQWKSAEPRPALPAEVDVIVITALMRLDRETVRS